MHKIYFIVNPASRNGYSKKIWCKLETELLKYKINYMTFFTEYPGNAKEMAASIAGENNGTNLAIIAIGGDGTIHEVINGVAAFNHVKVGYIPAGSGNDFARGFELPKDPLDALHVLLRLMKGEGNRVDVGKAVMANNEIFFINSMGAGFDALISKEANRSKIKRILNRYSMGSLVYVYYLLVKLFTYKTTSVSITIDKKIFQFPSTWFVTVSNHPYYGGGMKISPSASPSDGLLDVTVVHNLSKVKLLLVFISVFWGGHVSFKEVECFKGKCISIDSESPLDLHADGEQIGETPVEIQACPQVLPIIKRGITSKEELKELKSNGSI